MHNTLQELYPWLEFCYVEAKFTLIIKGYLTNSEKNYMIVLVSEMWNTFWWVIARKT